MKKILFILTSLLLFTLTLFAENKSRTFEVTYDFDIKYDTKNYPVKLWNPIPFDSSYQNIKMLTFDGNYDNFNINKNNSADATILYAQWQKENKPKKLHITLRIETKDRLVPLDVISKASAKNLPLPDAVKPFIKATAHLPTDGIVKELSDRITQNKTDRFEKVKAIYYWCTSHTFRDSKVKGCGVGDVHKMVTQKEVDDAFANGYYGGKCTDLSSLFVALVRAAGIPAREVFGIRLGKSHFSKALGKSDDKGFATITSWQHCRAEYFIPGVGWIPADPADITKLELVEKLKHNDPRVKELNNKYLHSWEMNWVGFNHGRDFVLSPKPTQYPINMLGYPYAEVEDDVLDYYEPKSFSYQITSQEIFK